MRLAKGQKRSDLEWLVEFDVLVRRCPCDQRKRGRLASGSASYRIWTPASGCPGAVGRPAAATARPLSILPALGGGLPPGFVKGEGMPPGSRQDPHRRVLRPPREGVSNWTLVSNARWRLSDEQFVVL